MHGTNPAGHGPAGRHSEPLAEPRTPAEAEAAIAATRERIEEELDELGDRVRSGKDRLLAGKERVMDVARAPVRQVRTHPWRAVAAALGAGFVVGVIQRARRHRDRRREALLQQRQARRRGLGARLGRLMRRSGTGP